MLLEMGIGYEELGGFRVNFLYLGEKKPSRVNKSICAAANP